MPRSPLQSAAPIASRRGRVGWWFLTLFQLLALTASFQLSTVSHFAIDLVQTLTVGHHHEAEDEDESDFRHDCPPGCPTCHHVHISGAALPPPMDSKPSGVPPERNAPAAGFADDDVPPGPHVPSIYRPPRA